MHFERRKIFQNTNVMFFVFFRKPEKFYYSSVNLGRVGTFFYLALVHTKLFFCNTFHMKTTSGDTDFLNDRNGMSMYVIPQYLLYGLAENTQRL